MSYTMLWSRTRSLWLVPIAGTLLACSAQVADDYRGEPIATLHGSVVASSAALNADLSAAIVWMVPDPDFEPKYLGERVAVDGSFPANFSLTLYAPPPAEAEFTTVIDLCDGETVTVGETVTTDTTDCVGPVVPSGTRTGMWIGLLAAIDATADGGIELEDIAGIDTDHWLIYYDEARSPTLPEMPTDRQLAQQMTTWGYDKELEAGYHLAKYDPDVQARARQGLECQWEGLCVHWTSERPALQDQRDWEYERCTERFPDNPTCRALVLPSGESEPKSSRECRERAEQLNDGRNCGFDKPGSLFMDNPKGLADPLMIQLGTTFWDLGL